MNTCINPIIALTLNSQPAQLLLRAAGVRIAGGLGVRCGWFCCAESARLSPLKVQGRR